MADFSTMTLDELRAAESDAEARKSQALDDLKQIHAAMVPLETLLAIGQQLDKLTPDQRTKMDQLVAAEKAKPADVGAIGAVEATP